MGRRAAKGDGRTPEAGTGGPFVPQGRTTAGGSRHCPLSVPELPLGATVSEAGGSLFPPETFAKPGASARRWQGRLWVMPCCQYPILKWLEAPVNPILVALLNRDAPLEVNKELRS